MSVDLLVMIGSRLRHKYFAIELMKAFSSSAALIETDFTDTAKIYVKEPTPEIRRHFEDFNETEKRYFKQHVEDNEAFLQSKLAREIPDRTINSPETVDFLKKLDPKVIAIHSTGLIKEAILEAFPRRLINLHAGLSPYYRGSGTNVWPFYNGELEHVGMTVHYIDIGIDSGDIILQGRPRFEKSDDTHTIGCKNLILGGELMRRVVERYLKEGPLPAQRQDKSRGKLYLKKQFTDETILKIKAFLTRGGVERHLNDPKDAPIVSW